MEQILARALGQELSPTVAAEKRDLLERLVARLAHEVRNPLSSLDVHVQLLEEDVAGLPPDARGPIASRLAIIHGELQRLEAVVDHFLRLAGPAELDLKMVELPKLVGHVCEVLRPEAEERKIDIKTQLGEGLPELHADPVRLTQGLMNLVINAMQAVEREAEIVVRVALAGAGVAIIVRDSGPGIPLERLGSIFDPYFTTKPEGSGLGLWIAQQIATAHGGNIIARNFPEGGAEFTMWLPLKAQETA